MLNDGNSTAGRPASLDRRNVLRTTGVSAVAVTALAAAGVASMAQPAEAQSVNDAAVLNFALNLEYLEAEFYMRAFTGVGLTSADTSGPGYANSVIGGAKVNFATPAIQQYAAEIAQDELNHVRFLRKGLGGAAVGEPAIDLANSFIALGNLIGVSNFNPFADENSFLLGAYVFEDVGVTAYHGAAALLQNKQILTAAAGILAVEAYHASEIRTILFSRGYGSTTVKISNVRASLSGAADDQGVINADGTANIVPSDSNALAFTRTPRQVLNIVYGAQNATGGLFFPAGMNGAVK